MRSNPFPPSGTQGLRVVTLGCPIGENHRVEVAGDRHPAESETLRVEHFEERREAVGMAVVGRRGEEQAMLEACARSLTAG